MQFATSYFNRYKSLPAFYPEPPDENVEILLFIPCYDDEFIFETLDSLNKANPIESKLEVIVIVNSGEKTPSAIVEKNRIIFAQLQEYADCRYYEKFHLLPIRIEGTVKKKAGVGFARKVGMDEAVRRFAAIQKPHGLIVSMDADTLVAPNYLQVVEQAAKNDSSSCFTFQFRHDFDPKRYPDEVIHACKQYETYLRYYRLALKAANYPFAIHTIGSCFAVRAEMYTKLGGMPIRQAGEDFYFLQKAAKMQPVLELKEQIVFPSPRISRRVPFGTGTAVENIIAEGYYPVYNFELFKILKSFYDLFPALEKNDVIDKIPIEVMHFIGLDDFNTVLLECRKYSASSKAFVKRMYDRFDAFFIIKFLNSFDKNSAFPPVDIKEAGKALLSFYGIEKSGDLYDLIVALDIHIS